MAPYSVLSVDDSRLSRQLLSAALRNARSDLDICEAASGFEALSTVAERAFDLIVIDLNMPGMSGEELACQLVERGVTTRLCFLTANVQSIVRDRLENGFGPVFNKPINESTGRDIAALLDQSA